MKNLDKEEFRVKLEEINHLVEQKDYKGAMNVVDKDHRTNEETGNVDAVMDGAIDIFINAYLKWIALAKRPAEQQ